MVNKLSHRYIIHSVAPHEKDGKVRDDETLLERYAPENKTSLRSEGSQSADVTYSSQVC